jgi:hypothetical protein
MEFNLSEEIKEKINSDYIEDNILIVDNTDKKPLEPNNPPLISSTSWMVKDIGEIDPNLNEYEKNVLLKGTYSVQDLLETEKTEEPVKVDKSKTFITKVKCIALKKLGYHPLTNPSNLTTREKQKIIKRMDKILKEKTEDLIEKSFNKLVLDELFSPTSDYTKYAIYN